ncbi:SGNH hydrolase-type esterase domain-containing protein [Baffinella frigidus]|nr:SGNH hydrolase-type esterase domain-containing protein [Cryptophyta sp. CCMP2293]
MQRRLALLSLLASPHVLATSPSPAVRCTNAGFVGAFSLASLHPPAAGCTCDHWRRPAWTAAPLQRLRGGSARQAAQPPSVKMDDGWPYDIYEGRHPPNPPQGRVVFYGDSDIEFWDLEKSFPGKGHLMVGVSGGWMKHALEYAPRMLEKYAPSVVVLVAGENDLGKGETPGAVAGQLKEIAALVRNSDPPCRLLYIGCKNEPKTKKLQPAYLELNEAVADWARDGSNDGWVVMLDCYGALSSDGKGAKPNKEMFADGIHLSEKGYQVWADMVEAALAELPS